MKRALLGLLQGVLFLFLISFLTFVFMDFAPGDFLDSMALDPRVTPELLESLRHLYGLDQPVHVQYGRWIQSVLSGDGGYSLLYRRPVWDLLAPRFFYTLVLALIALVASWGLALIVGLACALRAGGWFDRGVLAVVAVLSSVPEILVIFLGVGVAQAVGLPLGGATSVGHADFGFWAKILDRGTYLILPTSILVLGNSPSIIRHVRAAILSSLEKPFVAAARGHGIQGVSLWSRFVLPESSNHLLTLLGVSAPSVLYSGQIVELVLGLPGLGPVFVEATFSRDRHLFLGGIILGVVFLMIGNFLASLLVAKIDPRLRVSA